MRTLPDGAGDLQVDPVVAVESPRDMAQLSGRYYPSLLVREPTPRGSLNLLHRAIVSGTLRLARDRRLLAEQRLAYGPTDFSWLAFPADAAPPTFIRSFRSPLIGALESTSSISFEHAVRQRLRYTLTARYSATGGISDADQLLLPREHILDLSGTTSYGVHRETFSVAVTGGRGWISTGRTTALFGLSAGWRHSFRHRLESELSAGVSLLGGVPQEHNGAVPTVSASLWREAPVRRGAIGGRITVRSGPIRDRFTGALVQRAEGAARVDFAPVRPLVLSITGAMGVTPQAVTPGTRVLGQGAIGIEYKVTRALALSAGVRFVTLPDVEWAGLVASTFSEHGLF